MALFPTDPVEAQPDSRLARFWQPVVTEQWQQHRYGEVRIGERIARLQHNEQLTSAAAQPLGRFAILGIPECIGPRANCGQAGAEMGFTAFLQQFLNWQDSGLIPLDTVVLAGQVQCADLQAQANSITGNSETELSQLRALCSALDERVAAVAHALFAQGYQVIAIGGGHNNALPLLQALALATEQLVGAVNLDPHADFRPLEGRHSGNGFSYAVQQGYLQHYHVYGLHPAKNSAATLNQLAAAGGNYTLAQNLQGRLFSKGLPKLVQQVNQWRCPLGIELDIDAIYAAPASALNYAGVPLADALQYVQALAQVPSQRYLHLAEAAPACHPQGLSAGMKAAGQILSELVLTYILAHKN